MRLGPLVPVFAATLLASLTSTQEAAACGACFHLPSDNTVVTAHRMALSISPKHTVLWDQVQYSGDPEGFGWVLPVKPGAVIELSTDAWFDTLDATTTTQIFAPNVDCGGSSSGGVGCGSAVMSVREDSAGAVNDGTGSGGGPAVTVVHRGTVGPYETVTLSTETPGALNTWLTTAGYAIDEGTQPVIDQYVAEGFDFIALKLQPGQGVQAMKPVRVVQPGVNMTLPLRMVAIGTGANVAISLFVISEARWEAKNFGNGVAPKDLLSWDFQSQSSNYGALREKVLEQNGGSTWLTAFAFEGGLLQALPSQFFGTRGFGAANGAFSDTIAAAYVQQGLSFDETTESTCLGALSNIASSDRMVSNPCPAGTPFDDPSCGTVAANEIDARSLACGPLDDLAVALDGMHPKDVWLTRLEANLPRAALAHDLVVQPSASQETVDNIRQATIATNVDAWCGDGGAALPTMGPSKRGGSRGGPLVAAAIMGLAALAAAARRRFVRVPA